MSWPNGFVPNSVLAVCNKTESDIQSTLFSVIVKQTSTRLYIEITQDAQQDPREAFHYKTFCSQLTETYMEPQAMHKRL